jgi:predicted aconitase
MTLTEEERHIAAGGRGAGPAIAMRIVADAARMLGADHLLPIASAHIDGCLYHGDAGVLFAEQLVAGGASVTVPTTLNVGALDLLHPTRSRLAGHELAMARRMRRAYEALGCRPTWTCAPYQAGHRPAAGTDVAWGESNAVAFCNSVLGARTNRYGDFLDIACAIVGRAPGYGLHLSQARRARIVVEAGHLPSALRAADVVWPVLGAWLGRTCGDRIAVFSGLAEHASEDRLKALGAAAAAFGAVGLFHVAGVTPEAATVEAALGGEPAEETITLTPAMLRRALGWLSNAGSEHVDAIAVGSPHLSHEEVTGLLARMAGRRSTLPFFVHTSRHVLDRLAGEGRAGEFADTGLTPVVDTCIVVTPILPAASGTLLTNSGKFANYATGNTGWSVLYGSMDDCIASALAGRLVRDERVWA